MTEHIDRSNKTSDKTKAEQTQDTQATEATAVPEAEPATSAVPFDPFADDDDDYAFADGASTGTGAAHYPGPREDGDTSSVEVSLDQDNIASLLQDLQKIRDEKAQQAQQSQQKKPLEDTSTRASASIIHFPQTPSHPAHRPRGSRPDGASAFRRTDRPARSTH